MKEKIFVCPLSPPSSDSSLQQHFCPFFSITASYSPLLSAPLQRPERREGGMETLLPLFLSSFLLSSIYCIAFYALCLSIFYALHLSSYTSSLFFHITLLIPSLASPPGRSIYPISWGKSNACLVEAEPMQMVCPMPTSNLWKKAKVSRTFCKALTHSNRLSLHLLFTLSLVVFFYLLFSVCMFFVESYPVVLLSQLCLSVCVVTCVHVITTQCIQVRHLLRSAYSSTMELRPQTTGLREALLMNL